MIMFLKCWWLNLLILLAPKDLLQKGIEEAMKADITFDGVKYHWVLERITEDDQKPPK